MMDFFSAVASSGSGVVKETFPFTMASGNLTGSIGDVYMPTGATLVYEATGTAHVGVQNTNNSYFGRATPINALNPGLQNMVIRTVFKPVSYSSGYMILFDMGTGSNGTASGYLLSFDATFLYCILYDDSGFTRAYTEWNHGGSMGSTTEREAIWIVDRSQVKCGLIFDGDVKTTSQGAGGGAVALSDLGNIANVGACRMFANAQTNGDNFVGVLYDVDIAINTIDPNIFD